LVKLHSVDIAHCDIKPDNMVVVKSKDSGLGIKLIDFAFSKQCSKTLIKSERGTFNYMPPE
jgi:serine/threonine protein kinase